DERNDEADGDVGDPERGERGARLVRLVDGRGAERREAEKERELRGGRRREASELTGHDGAHRPRRSRPHRDALSEADEEGALREEAPIVDDDREDRSELDDDVEGVRPFAFLLQETRREDQVPRRGDG